MFTENLQARTPAPVGLSVQAVGVVPQALDARQGTQHTGWLGPARGAHVLNVTPGYSGSWGCSRVLCPVPRQPGFEPGKLLAPNPNHPCSHHPLGPPLAFLSWSGSHLNPNLCAVLNGPHLQGLQTCISPALGGTVFSSPMVGGEGSGTV